MTMPVVARRVIIRALVIVLVTQSEVAQMMGWGRDSVKNYASLQKICPEAWGIVGTTFEGVVPIGDEEVVPTNGTTVPIFSERLLRSILNLTHKQQVELVKSFAFGDINKGTVDLEF